jgi:hypothetical protein
MKSIRNGVLAIAAVALATVSISAVPAAAQSPAYKGSFTLPNEVRWQGKTLPAGDYTFSMKSAATPAMVELQGPNGGAFIVALTVDKAAAGDHSFMTLERRSGSSIVRDLYLAEIGVRIHYPVPKPDKDQQLAQGPVATEQVLIASAK